MATEFLRSLPRYRCHKEVSALKVAAVIPNPRGAELHFSDRRYAPHQVPNAWCARHEPREGSYLVIYDDGYQSISPPEAFEAGYTLIDANEAIEDVRRFAEHVPEIGAAASGGAE